MVWFRNPYVITKFKLKATIGGIEFPDVVSCSATFGLNSIPACSLIVATGKEIRSGRSATIHDAKKKLQPRDKATVTLTLTVTDGQTDKMETGTFTIFDGFYAGIGYQRSFNSANYTLNLIHWLDDLNASSMVNGNWFPGAPYDLAQNAAYFALDPNEGAGTYWSTVPTIDVRGDIITAAKIKQDLWGEVLKPIFNKIAQWPSPRYQGEKPGTNDAAIAALARMPGTGAPYYKKLALDTTGLSSRDVEYAMRSGISIIAPAITLTPAPTTGRTNFHGEPATIMITSVVAPMSAVDPTSTSITISPMRRLTSASGTKKPFSF